MSAVHFQDRSGQTRRLWQGFFVGVLLAALGTLMAYIGWLIIMADVENRRPILDLEMTLFATGALIVGPLGIGSMLAATAGLFLTRGFRLRTFFIAIAVCGVVMAACSGAIRDYLRSWEGYAIAVPVPSFVPLAGTATSHQFVGPLYLVTGYTAASIVLVIATLPFLILPVVLRHRRATSN